MKKTPGMFETIPWYYGFAWREPMSDKSICYPIPLNMIMRWLHELLLRVRAMRHPDWFGKIIGAAIREYEREREVKPKLLRKQEEGGKTNSYCEHRDSPAPSRRPGTAPPVTPAPPTCMRISAYITL